MPETTINGDSSDRLSNLPNDILVTILSLLKPREMVQTSLLSKRYLDLWSFTHHLHFNSKDFIDHERFHKFVNKFLSLCDQSTDLHSFSFQHTHSQSGSEIPDLDPIQFHYALNRNPKEVELHWQECIDFPNSLYTCESLEDLSLGLNNFVFTVPDIISLPNLENLYIEYLYAANGHSMQRVFSGCPALESLTLYGCSIKMKDNNIISIPNLKELSLSRLIFISESEWKVSHFYISAPSVEDLYFYGQIASETRLKNMDSIKKVKIIFCKDSPEEHYDCEIISSLSGVETLNIESENLLKESLEGEIATCPIFHNLKKFIIGQGCMHCAYGSLCSFLKHCPNLEILTLYHNEENCMLWNAGHNRKKKDRDLGELEKFGCDKLKLINLFYCELDYDVDWVVRRLVRSTIGIKNVKIILEKEF